MCNKKKKYRKYTDNDIILGAKTVKSIAGLLRYLNLKVAGGNYANIKKNLQRLCVDTSHWTGQGWSKDQQLKDWSNYKLNSFLKKNIIRIRGNICEKCKNTHWLDLPIKLEIHHKDGDRTNNEIDNLELLCPNCHSFTDNWRGKNLKSI